MKRFPAIFLSLVLFILFIPIVMTFLYSISTNWHSTILPEGYTLQSYVDIFTDKRFLSALGRTLLVTISTTVISLIIMVPTIFIIIMHFPKLEKVLQLFVLMPYAIPGVIGAVGLIEIYSSGPIAISGTIWILIGAYIVAVLPFMYQGIRNSLRNIQCTELVHAAETLGVNRIQTFIYVILPSITPGIMVSALLSFSVLFGEFVLAKLLVGGGFETIQVYLSQMIQKSGRSGSAIVIAYFTTVLVCSFIALKFSKKPSN